MLTLSLRIYSGVVTYRPEQALLLDLVSVLAQTTECVLIFANSPLSQVHREELLAVGGSARIEIIQSRENVGLGSAYNEILRRAGQYGGDAVLLVDQDSTLRPQVVRHLADLMVELAAAGQQVAAVGVQPVGPRQATPAFKDVRIFLRPGRDGAARFRAVDFVISSGSLVSIAAYQAVGPFRDDFFIDAVDIEWCFRAWHRGFSCWVARDARMEHRLGRGSIAVPLLRLTLPVQPPTRLYTYVRNQVRMLAMRHVPLRWKAKMLPYIGLQAIVYALKGRRRSYALTAIARGVWDGLRTMSAPAQQPALPRFVDEISPPEPPGSTAEQ
ncbi:MULTISPECIES: glycosyltransferase [Chelatococcus]|uniref:glycosyltransferase n=1 Tax=Chelatococcus TaxID=28209 RepID=UPI0006BD43F5|nr:MULTISPECIES: glycosyltransferase family 2 protein [unclassified Chelatococcus]ALA20501.1 hypothetical protein AL346_24265 [Chelatococcus sp. CO-6]